jgi:hypothetical protein
MPKCSRVWMVLLLCLMAPLAAMAMRSRRPPPLVFLQPTEYHLGVMIDAGRNFFPMVWLYGFVDHLYDLGYTLIHFRLTDDQVFAVQLLRVDAEEAYPELAYSSNNTTYTPIELTSLVRYAKSLNITIIPEMNVPGHAGAWAGIPELVVPCPLYTCDVGYVMPGMPLNLTHIHMPAILKGVLSQILEIFDRPPFLHLGGNDVHLAAPCWKEVGIILPNYTAFERGLQQILTELDYPETQVIRWDNTKKNDNQYSNMEYYPTAGRIVHVQDEDDYLPDEDLDDEKGDYSYYFATPKSLALNLNGGDTGWDVYLATQRMLKKNKDKGRRFLGIIVGTLELGPQSFLHRNVLGRLLAVSMAAANATGTTTTTKTVYTQEARFGTAYSDYCRRLELAADQIACELLGAPSMDLHAYQIEWKHQWGHWKSNLCQRLTIATQVLQLCRPNMAAAIQVRAHEQYWETLAEESPSRRLLPLDLPMNNQSLLVDPIILSKSKIRYRGIIFDLVQDLVPPNRFQRQILEEMMVPLGLNMLQLALATNEGFAVRFESNPRLYHLVGSLPSDAQPYGREQLQTVVDAASAWGIQVVPELVISTNAGGWYNSGLLVHCPRVLCEGSKSGGAGGMALDVTEGAVLPLLRSVIQEVRQIFFNNSGYLHLGSDERQDSLQCWNESGQEADYDGFEERLSYLLLGLYDPQHILRWENREQFHYPKRTGDVTHYHRAPPTTNQTFFGTVFITKEKTPWSIYQETRQWVASKPTGLLAKIEDTLSPHSNHELGQRLLAFAIGMAERPNSMDQTEFDVFFAHTCGKTLWCQASGRTFLPPPKSNRQMLCRTMTKTLTVPVTRDKALSAKEMVEIQA